MRAFAMRAGRLGAQTPLGVGEGSGEGWVDQRTASGRGRSSCARDRAEPRQIKPFSADGWPRSGWPSALNGGGAMAHGAELGCVHLS